MSEDDEALRRSMSDLLALVVHDLRNPVATLSANLSFVRDVGPSAEDDEDVAEALADMDIAMGDLMRGLEHLAWVGRWIGRAPALEGGTGDAREAIRSAQKRVDVGFEVELPDEPLVAQRAGAPLSRLVEILVRNALQYAPSAPARVLARRDGDDVVIEVHDTGPAVAPALREAVFDMDGQQLLKGRLDGRYSRMVGLLAARALADALDARVAAEGEDGTARFVVRLAAAPS